MSKKTPTTTEPVQDNQQPSQPSQQSRGARRRSVQSTSADEQLRQLNELLSAGVRQIQEMGEEVVLLRQQLSEQLGQVEQHVGEQIQQAGAAWGAGEQAQQELREEIREQLLRIQELLTELQPAVNAQPAADQQHRTPFSMPFRPAHPAETLLDQLQHAWAVEALLLDQLQELIEQVAEPHLQHILAEHRQVTQKQKTALEARLKELGQVPSRPRQQLQRWLDRLGAAWQGHPEAYDRQVACLLKAVSAQHFEIAMYQFLGALAHLAADEVTAELAAHHLRQEQEAAERLAAVFGTEASAL